MRTDQQSKSTLHLRLVKRHIDVVSSHRASRIFTIGFLSCMGKAGRSAPEYPYEIECCVSSKTRNCSIFPLCSLDNQILAGFLFAVAAVVMGASFRFRLRYRWVYRFCNEKTRLLALQNIDCVENMFFLKTLMNRCSGGYFFDRQNYFLVEFQIG